MKRILLLGGSAQQVVAIKTAKRLGYYTILCDYLTDNPGQNYCDKFFLESTTDVETILRIARKEHIDGILAYASDPAAPTAAYVAEKLKLPTNPLWAVDTLCNKDKFRIFLKNNGFNSPQSKGYSDKKEIEHDVKDCSIFNFPVIIKPVDSSGSKGATVLHSWQGLSEAVDLALSFSRSHRIIIEEYIEKKHPYLIGGDVFVNHGEVILWGLMNCHRDNSVNPLVPVGKSFPPVLSKTDLNSVKEVLQNMVTKLGFKFGSMNVELVIDKSNRIWPIDIGPRAGGNMIPDLLGLIFDCDLVEMSVQAAMGKEIPFTIGKGHNYYATFNLHSDRNGIFSDIQIDPKIEKYIIREVIYKKQGDKVRYFANASDALGIVFFKFPNKEIMINTEEHMNEYIHIVLKGDE